MTLYAADLHWARSLRDCYTREDCTCRECINAESWHLTADHVDIQYAITRLGLEGTLKYWETLAGSPTT